MEQELRLIGNYYLDDPKTIVVPLWKWHYRFLRLAKYWALECSKDPSTKVGAVVARGKHEIVMGYNGFPAGIEDTPERYADRDFKYDNIIHAEMNAIHNATESLRGCTLYCWPFMPCSTCAGHIIQQGITEVIAPYDENPRWIESFNKSLKKFNEAKVTVVLTKREI